MKAVYSGKRYLPRDIAVRLAGRMLMDDLTARERQTMELMAKGCTNREIGEALKLSENTIRHYVNHVMEKLNVSDRTEADATAFKMGIL